MRTENIEFLTENEDEIVRLFVELGLKRDVAKILVFLAKTPDAKSHAIERGIDLRQPGVSIAMRDLMKDGWVRTGECPATGIGRPEKRYNLIKSLPEILDSLEERKEKEADSQRQVIQKLRGFLKQRDKIS